MTLLAKLPLTYLIRLALNGPKQFWGGGKVREI